MPPRFRICRARRLQRAAAWAVAAALCAATVAAHAAGDAGAARRVADVSVAPGALHTGILLDRVALLGGIVRFDGTATAPPATRARWRQILFELAGASDAPLSWATGPAMLADARRTALGAIPVAIVDLAYERLRDPERAAGLVGAADVVAGRVFAAAPLRETTYRGGECRFAFERRWLASDRAAAFDRLEVDLDDGHGWRAVRWGDRPVARYDRPGTRIVRLRAAPGGQPALQASFTLQVAALGTPSPDDTLQVTASVPYQGLAGTGDAYVYLAPGHTALVNPIVVIEGFDIDDSLGWDELYALLQQENLLETLRAQGFDLVVLDFQSATDYIQRNAFVVTELLSRVQAAIAPDADCVVVGASMGGLVGRYALAVLESQGTPARVRTFISFDAPQRGANIPLGVQYWVEFFADLSADAAFQRDLLNTAAARQMLLAHFTVPASATAAPDPLRAQLLADLAAAGGYPQQPRLVAMANGSGSGAGQGYDAAAQIVRYEYDSFLVDIRGNVWAVPELANATILQGSIDYLIGTDRSSIVTVAPPGPYDNAPGGWRSTMADMDATTPPFGDIVALQPNHCFIPTVSALDVGTPNWFYDIAGDPNVAALSPFDALYYPSTNQGHVFIDAATVAWLLAEIPPVPTAVGPVPVAVAPALAVHPNVPNPFNPATRIEFDVPREARVEVTIRDAAGRRVATLLDALRTAGRHAVVWDGRTDAGARAASGVYLCAVESGGAVAAQRMVLVK